MAKRAAKSSASKRKTAKKAATRPAKTAKKRPAKRPSKPSGPSPAELRRQELRQQYERKRAAAAAGSRDRAAEGAEIGPLPAPANPKRKAACARDLKLFCETYLRPRFPLAWSSDHHKVIAHIQQAVLQGGLFALAMPRGSGKTTLCESACLWAALYGHHEFVALVGATMTAAQEMLASIKMEIETNPAIIEDFPEVSLPVLHLEGVSSRQNKQTYQGERTRLKWDGESRVVFPAIQGSAASSVIVKCAGITARLRGMKYARPGGEQVRPTLAVIDDPQTDDSAGNPNTVGKRLKVINGTVLRSVAPGKTMSALCPCTVIQKGDLADQLLDRSANPHWAGERYRALYEWPTNMDRWREYADLLAEELRNDGDGSEANAFVRQHWDELHAGAVVAWPERFGKKELSGLQHCMNVFFEEPDVFYAEYQNDPPTEDSGIEQLDAALIAVRVNNIPRGTVPSWGERLVGYIDVQQASLWWLVCAFDERFSGAVVDYDVFPRQRTNYPRKAQLDVTLQDLLPGAGIEGQLRNGLDLLITELCSREWKRDGGGTLRLEKLLVDRGYQQRVIDQACRSHTFAALLTPSKGRGIGAKHAPMRMFKRRPGERLGANWMTKKEGAVQTLEIDTNHWKSFVAARLQTAVGDPGALTLYGKLPHKLLADHLTSEYFKRVESEGRTVDEWELKPHKPDNEWWDCLIGCHVAASMLGIELAPLQTAGGGQKPKLKLSELQRKKRGRR